VGLGYFCKKAKAFVYDIKLETVRLPAAAQAGKTFAKNSLQNLRGLFSFLFYDQA